MSLLRYAKKRDLVEPGIVQALRAVGAHVWHLDRPFDLLVGFRGRFTVLECKSDPCLRKKQQHQTDELLAAQAMGLPVYRVTTPTEALIAVGAQVPTEDYPT